MKTLHTFTLTLALFALAACGGGGGSGAAGSFAGTYAVAAITTDIPTSALSGALDVAGDGTAFIDVNEIFSGDVGAGASGAVLYELETDRRLSIDGGALGTGQVSESGRVALTAYDGPGGALLMGALKSGGKYPDDATLVGDYHFCTIEPDSAVAHWGHLIFDGVGSVSDSWTATRRGDDVDGTIHETATYEVGPDGSFWMDYAILGAAVQGGCLPGGAAIAAASTEQGTDDETFFFAFPATTNGIAPVLEGSYFVAGLTGNGNAVFGTVESDGTTAVVTTNRLVSRRLPYTKPEPGLVQVTFDFSVDPSGGLTSTAGHMEGAVSPTGEFAYLAAERTPAFSTTQPSVTLDDPPRVLVLIRK